MKPSRFCLVFVSKLDEPEDLCGNRFKGGSEKRKKKSDNFL